MQREELGVSLYNLQQELAKQQTALEKEHDNFNQLNKERQVSEADLSDTRSEYKQLLDKLNQLHQKRKFYIQMSSAISYTITLN